MKKLIYKFTIFKLCYLLFFITIFSMCSSNSGTQETNSGILLSFDDYFPEQWEEHFDLFDKYNARVTFFVNGNSVTQFMLDAQKRGHEIGYHTISHPSLPALTREQFLEETISRIEVFSEHGINLTSFAYPYGRYELWMHDELLEYYKIVRGFTVPAAGPNSFGPYEIADMKHGFINSKSIDNVYYNDIEFQQFIDEALQMAKASEDVIITLTSHQISSTPHWGITPEKLEYLLKKGKEYGLTFYRYNELQ